MKVLCWRKCAAMRRAGQHLPMRGERTWVVRLRTKEVLARWIARQGVRYLATRPIDGHDQIWKYVNLSEEYSMPIRRRAVDPLTLAAPEASSETTYLTLNPLLVEFATATSYDDGAPRVPGYFTVRIRGTEWECTLYDPDGGVRLPVRAPTVDDMMLAVETALGTESASWEPDQYLLKQLAQRPKKHPVDKRKKTG